MSGDCRAPDMPITSEVLTKVMMRTLSLVCAC